MNIRLLPRQDVILLGLWLLLITILVSALSYAYNILMSPKDRHVMMDTLNHNNGQDTLQRLRQWLPREGTLEDNLYRYLQEQSRQESMANMRYKCERQGDNLTLALTMESGEEGVLWSTLFAVLLRSPLPFAVKTLKCEKVMSTYHITTTLHHQFLPPLELQLKNLEGLMEQPPEIPTPHLFLSSAKDKRDEPLAVRAIIYQDTDNWMIYLNNDITLTPHNTHGYDVLDISARQVTLQGPDMDPLTLNVFGQMDKED